MALLDHDGVAEFPYRLEDVFGALVEAIPTIPGMTLASADKLSGRLLVKTGMSLFSWGETIPITVTLGAEGRTRVSVTSTPKTGVMFGGAFDMGKNRRNIEQILAAASQRLAKAAPPPLPVDQVSTGDIETRLRRLQELLEKKLITNEDFERRKSEILREV